MPSLFLGPAIDLCGYVDAPYLSDAPDGSTCSSSTSTSGSPTSGARPGRSGVEPRRRRRVHAGRLRQGLLRRLTEDAPGSLCHDHGYRIPGRSPGTGTQRLAAKASPLVLDPAGDGLLKSTPVARKRSLRPGSSSRSRSRRCSRSSSSTRRSPAGPARPARARCAGHTGKVSLAGVVLRPVPATRTHRASASGCATSLARRRCRSSTTALGARSLPGRPPTSSSTGRCKPASSSATPGHARDEVPVEVPQPTQERRRCPSSVGPSSSASGSPPTRS